MKPLRSRFFCITLFTLLLLAAITATAQQNVPRLRVANFMENPPAAKLDFYIDDIALPFAIGLAFADASAAERIAAGNHSVTAVPAGMPKSAVIFTEQFTITADSAFTLCAVRTPGDTLRGLVVSRMLLPQITKGEWLAGVLHLAPKLGTIHWRSIDAGGTVGIDNDFWFDRTAKGHLYYASLPEGPMTSTITSQELTSDNQFVDQYLGNRVVTFILTGDAVDGTLALYTLRDDDTLEQRLVHKQRRPRQGDGAVRTVNLVPDLFHIDQGIVQFVISSYNSGSPEFRHAMTRLRDLSGETRVQASVGLTAPSRIFQSFDDTLNVGVDTLYTYFMVGTAKDTMAGPLVLRTPLSEAPSIGKVWLRLLHAAPDIGPVDLHIMYGDGSEKHVSNLRFKNAGDYSEVAPGPLTVQMFAAGTSTLLMEGKGTLPADSAWTLIVDGLKSGRSLGMNLLNDNDTNGQAPMILLNGSASVEDQQETSTGMSLAVWPNPAGESVNVSYMLLHSTQVRFALYDLTGRLVSSEQYARQASGRHTAKLATEALAKGTYQVVLTQSDGTMQMRAMLVVVR